MRYGFWCFDSGVGGVGGGVDGHVIDAVFVHIGTDLGVGIGRRDAFGAMTGREAISAQNICFLGVAVGAFDDCFGVAGEVRGSEISMIGSD